MIRRLPTAPALVLLAATAASTAAFAPVPRSAFARPRFGVAPTALTVVVTAEEAPRNLPPLDPWCVEAGVQKVDGLELYTEDGRDWEYVATVDIPTGTTLMCVPAGVCLSSTAVMASLTAASGGGVAAAVDELTRIGGQNSVADFALFVRLLAEYEAGENSPYRAWLDALPRLYYNAASMTDFCYECLPPLVFSLSRLEKVKFDNFRQVLQKVDLVSDMTKQNEEVLKWAFNSVYTRAYADKDGQGSDVTLTPLADMFNHGTEPNIEVYFDEGMNALVYTTADVAANTPLRISYGCPTNPSFLFARYGFLDETSPATFCKMMDVPKTPENVAMGMDFSKMLFYHDTGDISQEVMDVVLYAKVLEGLKSSPETDGYKQAFYDAHVQGDADTKGQIAAQYRYETLTEIKRHVDTFLEALGELEKKSYGKSLDEHPRLPLILRHNEFVKQTFLKVQSNLAAAGVGQAEYA